MNESPDERESEREPVVDAVLTASRVLVAVAARSLAEVAEEVTLTQYRSLVVLASRGPPEQRRARRGVGGDPVDGIEIV